MDIKFRIFFIIQIIRNRIIKISHYELNSKVESRFINLWLNVMAIKKFSYSTEKKEFSFSSHLLRNHHRMSCVYERHDINNGNTHLSLAHSHPFPLSFLWAYEMETLTLLLICLCKEWSKLKIIYKRYKWDRTYVITSRQHVEAFLNCLRKFSSSSFWW